MKLLIIGATAFLGKKIMARCRERGIEACGTGFGRGGGDVARLDVRDKDAVGKAVRRDGPDAVLLVSAKTDLDWCETHRKETNQVNVEGARNVADVCAQNHAKMVLYSTDYVFDGRKRGKYAEGDERKPLSVYAESKARAEGITERMQNHLIIRTTNIYGYNCRGDKEVFATLVLRKLTEGAVFRAFTDQFCKPTLIDDVAEATISLLGKGRTGIYHAVGSEYLNKYEFAKRVAQVFGLDESLIEPVESGTAGQIAERPKRLDTSNEKIMREGIRMRSAGEGLGIMRRQMEEDGWEF